MQRIWRPPTHLGKHGKRLWLNLGPTLLGLGRLQEEDRLIFETLCTSYNLLCECDVDIQTHGVSVADNRGSLKKNPSLMTRKDALDVVLLIISKFGLSPMDRKKMDLPILDKNTAKAENDLFGGGK